MLRINLYSKEWKRRYLELIELDMRLEKFYLDVCESRARGENFYVGKYISEVLENTEEVIEYNRKEIKQLENMTLLQKLRYKG